MQHLGSAVGIIPTIDLKFDLVSSADKENYLTYWGCS
jgi:hypothetical protein